MATRNRLNIRDAINDLAPQAPPCFHNHLEWMEYLQSAGAAQTQAREPKIILLIEGEPRINPLYPYCQDCTQVKSLEMDKIGKCNPNHLKEIYGVQILE